MHEQSGVLHLIHVQARSQAARVAEGAVVGRLVEHGARCVVRAHGNDVIVINRSRRRRRRRHQVATRVVVLAEGAPRRRGIVVPSPVATLMNTCRRGYTVLLLLLVMLWQGRHPGFVHERVTSIRCRRAHRVVVLQGWLLLVSLLLLLVKGSRRRKQLRIVIKIGWKTKLKMMRR